MAPSSVIEVVEMAAEMPPGVLGPDSVTLDVRCFLVAPERGLVLVDTGLPRSATAIEATLERIGARWSDITDIVLTHAHFDHFGGLAEVVDRTPQATVWAGARDVAAIPVGGGLVVNRLGEGDQIDGLLVLDTPGHTPGHISLLDAARSLIIVGDLVGSVDGALSFGPPAFTADVARSRASLARVAGMGVDRLLLSHGPEVPDARDRISELLASSE